MLIVYLKSALRSLRRHKVSSLINVISLSIGISASLVIYLIVHYELSFDTFERDRDRVFRVVSKVDYPDMTMYNPGIEVPAARAIPREIAGVELATHIVTANDLTVTVENGGALSPKVFRHQQEIIYADSAYFELIGYRWLAGSAATALQGPFRVVLTERRARLYFPGLQPVDVVSKRLMYDDSIAVTVTGVVADLDEITDFGFQEFVSMQTVEQTGLKNRWSWDEWGSVNSASQLFVRLVRGADAKAVERQIVDLQKRHSEEKDRVDQTRHYLQPLSDIHLNPQYGSFDNRTQGDRSVLYGLLAIAAFLLFLGSMNFINLATAQAVDKAKEIGIRKTLGSSRGQLLMQFLFEAILLTSIAAILSLALAQVLLHVFRPFIPEGIEAGSVLTTHVAIFLIVLTVAVSVLSGLYPAFFLARLQPSSILRNQASAGTPATRSAVLRKSLTIIQFAVAQTLIIATIVVSKQIHFSLAMDLGYRRDAIVWFRVPFGPIVGQWTSSMPPVETKRFALVEQLKQIPGITTVSLAGTPPASTSTSSTFTRVNNGKNLIETMVEMKTADPAYFDLYGMRLIAGRNLQASDTTHEYVINETYAKFLGFANPKDAVGCLMQTHIQCPIVGVLADFHTKSTHVPIKPLAYSAASSNSSVVHVALNRADPSSWKASISAVEKVFKKFYPDNEFNPMFFDESVAAFYKKDQQTSFLLNWAAGLAMLISCLGLLGLVIHTTKSRTKEIGVRKVLGASVPEIISLLSKEFILLVAVGLVLAAPLGWWAMHGWLEDFAYQTALSWWIFLLAGGVAVVIALLTVSTQAVRAARANPVEALRYE